MLSSVHAVLRKVRNAKIFLPIVQRVAVSMIDKHVSRHASDKMMESNVFSIDLRVSSRVTEPPNVVVCSLEYVRVDKTESPFP